MGADTPKAVHAHQSKPPATLGRSCHRAACRSPAGSSAGSHPAAEDNHGRSESEAVEAGSLACRRGPRCGETSGRQAHHAGSWGPAESWVDRQVSLGCRRAAYLGVDIVSTHQQEGIRLEEARRSHLESQVAADLDRRSHPHYHLHWDGLCPTTHS